MNFNAYKNLKIEEDIAINFNAYKSLKMEGDNAINFNAYKSLKIEEDGSFSDLGHGYLRQVISGFSSSHMEPQDFLPGATLNLSPFGLGHYYSQQISDPLPPGEIGGLAPLPISSFDLTPLPSSDLASNMDYSMPPSIDVYFSDKDLESFVCDVNTSPTKYNGVPITDAVTLNSVYPNDFNHGDSNVLDLINTRNPWTTEVEEKSSIYNGVTITYTVPLNTTSDHKPLDHGSSSKVHLDNTRNRGDSTAARKSLLPTNRPRGLASHITLEMMKKYFMMPIEKASKELKVGLTTLKKRCRQLGIPWWPYRKMNSMDSLICNVQEFGNNDDRRNLAMLEVQRQMMEENPKIDMTVNTKKLRQICYKAKYKKKRGNRTWPSGV